VKVAEITSQCCSPLLQEPLAAAEAEQLASALRVLGDPARLRLLSLIATSPGAEACVCELIEPLGLAQPTVSHHLRVLHEAGLLEREKKGAWVYYRLSPAPLLWLQQAIAPAAIGAPA
jgi:ArsR family transcriptional regulator, arsenate/arsenite/antimonite-responsive transcriptional repressor